MDVKCFLWLIYIQGLYTLKSETVQQKKLTKHVCYRNTTLKNIITIGIVISGPESNAFDSICSSITKFMNKINIEYRKKLDSNRLQFVLMRHTRDLSLNKLWKLFCKNKSGLLRLKINSLIYLEYNHWNFKKKNSVDSRLLLHFIKLHKIPTIIWQNEGIIQANRGDLTLQLMPSIEQQVNVMLDFLLEYKWATITIITSKLTGYIQFVQSLRYQINTEMKYFHIKIQQIIHIFYTKDKELIELQMKKIDKKTSNILFLYCSRDEANEIFKIANQLGLTEKKFVWIAAKSVISPMAAKFKMKERLDSLFPLGMFAVQFKEDEKGFFNNGNSKRKVEQVIKNIQKGISIWIKAVVNIHETSSKDRLTFRPHFTCNRNDNLFNWNNSQIMYDEMLNNSWSLKPNLESFQMNHDGTLANAEISLLNLGMSHKRAEKTWKEIGSWNSKLKKLQMTRVTFPGGKTKPPESKTQRQRMKIVTLEENPYVIYSNPNNVTGKCLPHAKLCRIASKEQVAVSTETINPNHYQCCSGFCIDLLLKLSKELHFDFELFQVRDGKWGAYNTDRGEWNGLIKDILDKEADMVVTSLKINPERAAAIDFSVPFLETGISIIVRVQEGVISPTAFLKPYDMYSWCIILAFCVNASGVAVFLFEWLSPYGLDRGSGVLKGHRFSLFRALWLIWAILFGAAVNVDNPKGMSSKFIGSIWALFAMVFTASYTANLAAFMITKDHYEKLSGIQDWRLINAKQLKPPFKFGTVPDGSTETNLKHNFPQMHEYMKQFNKSTVKLGVEAVKDGSINAFIYDATVLEYIASKDDDCKLKTVGAWYAMTGYGMGFPKKSPWKAVIDRYILKFQQEGELERLQEYWLRGGCTAAEGGEESSAELGVPNFTSAFLLLIAGMLLGLIILFLEHMLFRFCLDKIRAYDRCGISNLFSLSVGKSSALDETVMSAIKDQSNAKCTSSFCELKKKKLQHQIDKLTNENTTLKRDLSSSASCPRAAKENYMEYNGPKIIEEYEIYEESSVFYDSSDSNELDSNQVIMTLSDIYTGRESTTRSEVQTLV
ncbi:DgyrCDS8104 [Dimorphilus gyrociliatus]|uniref:DgyrCDS8104 n=1 Tax=Dimorphilus gyrociliatus TaxID=2664684 RepID=A0A7I8VVG3_9ANNE|nr:DgyrCDS8104 [Dimorphilus gyrociliatus]